MLQEYQRFYDEYKDKLFSYLMFKSGDYEVSQDVMQESFTRHLKHYGKDSTASPALLFTIARNALVDHFRYQDQFQAIQYISSTTVSDEEQSHIVKEESGNLLRAMKKLPEQEREILTLAVAGVPYKQIANSYNLTLSNIKIKVHRARIKLRTILGSEER